MARWVERAHPRDIRGRFARSGAARRARLAEKDAARLRRKGKDPHAAIFGGTDEGTAIRRALTEQINVASANYKISASLGVGAAQVYRARRGPKRGRSLAYAQIAAVAGTSAASGLHQRRYARRRASADWTHAQEAAYRRSRRKYAAASAAAIGVSTAIPLAQLYGFNARGMRNYYRAKGGPPNASRSQRRAFRGRVRSQTRARNRAAGFTPTGKASRGVYTITSARRSHRSSFRARRAAPVRMTASSMTLPAGRPRRAIGR